MCIERPQSSTVKRFICDKKPSLKSVTEEEAKVEKEMKAAAKELDFITAAQKRDEMLALKKVLGDKFG